MPSLLVTKDDGVPRVGDWDNASRRQAGQVEAGKLMLANFQVNGTNEKQIVEQTLQGIWDAGCSIWLRYDGDKPDSIAIIDKFEDDDLTEEERALSQFMAGFVKLTYYEVAPGNVGDPVVAIGGGGKLTLRIQDDSPPGNTANKKMNVVIPSDFATFKDQYLQDMTGDIDNLTVADDVPYLLSSLTFRRCL
ncbi:hypothetical protein [Sulfitobacter aestuariivivens]|uniref:Uncharacterized protein n=1 Tax=Sulfitobacter aestuariivivens TaxID=2766981 RepID=A0A927DB96_9RHOB|nr:hypothetical protein [Sulfitobacter aestuariivivens]MBD3666106.1 hypothetical protein [Sulfitobacter aestuariivivens]